MNIDLAALSDPVEPSDDGPVAILCCDEAVEQRSTGPAGQSRLDQRDFDFAALAAWSIVEACVELSVGRPLLRAVGLDTL
jgi:hypothetical protein